MLTRILSAGAAADASWLMELVEANVKGMISEMETGDAEMVEMYFSAYHYFVARIGNTAPEAAVIVLKDPDTDVQPTGVLGLAAVLGMLVDFPEKTLGAGKFDVIVQQDPEA